MLSMSLYPPVKGDGPDGVEGAEAGRETHKGHRLTQPCVTGKVTLTLYHTCIKNM